MAGKNDRIHGYNPVYRNENGPTNFWSFEFTHNRPDQFIFKPIEVINGPTVLDHQGHIVSQDILNKILDPLMDKMACQCNNMDDVHTFIKENSANYPWLMNVLEYGKGMSTDLFDFEENNIERKVGHFFSVVTWNPVNICRAPSDNLRNGYPENAIDTQVADYLKKHKEIQHVNENWIEALHALIPEKTNEKKIKQYITACCATLNDQLQHGIGYYAFQWEYIDLKFTEKTKRILIPKK